MSDGRAADSDLHRLAVLDVLETANPSPYPSNATEILTAPVVLWITLKSRHGSFMIFTGLDHSNREYNTQYVLSILMHHSNLSNLVSESKCI